MRSGWLRRSSRLVAALLLLTSLWQLPHRWGGDGVCAPAAEAHDESKHAYTVPSDQPHQDHCAVCHWTRWLNPMFSAGPAVAINTGAGYDLVPLSPSLLRDPSTDRLPARAPPAL
jgi:hypothetical protein